MTQTKLPMSFKFYLFAYTNIHASQLQILIQIMNVYKCNGESISMN